MSGWLFKKEDLLLFMLQNDSVIERHLINYRSIRALSINSAKLHFRSLKVNSCDNVIVSYYSISGRIKYFLKSF